MSKRDYYEILEVTKTCSDGELKSAYRKLAMRFHPDRNPGDKIAEELAEVANAADDAERHEEVGDLLFAVVNYARKLGVDAESALRDANLKFARRFAAMEDRAGGSIAGLSLDAQEDHWLAVKASERR